MRELSGSLGSDMKDIAQRIHSLNKQAKLMQDFTYDHDRNGHKEMHSGIVKFMIEAMQQRHTLCMVEICYIMHGIL